MDTRTMRWTPPNGHDAELTAAGEDWDALRLPAYLGDLVLDRLGGECGAVIGDPYAQRMYWLIRPGAAAGWTFPDIAYVQLLGTASWVGVPPRDRSGPPGLHWAKLPEGSLLTDPESLHYVLSAVIADVLGPREVSAR